MHLKTPPKSSSLKQAPYFLGVDVGGTSIKIGLVDDLGRTLAFRSIATDDAQGAQKAIARAAQTCHELVKCAGVRLAEVPRAGLGTPGPMSLPEGKLLDPTNLPSWHNFHVQAALAQALDMPVSFINDANAAAFGEFWVGRGVDHGSLALLTLGTGVGGGLIIEGKLVNGVNSFGSELGHIVVDSRPDARLCVWGGGKGHLEAYASASAVAARANAAVRAGVDSSLRDIARANAGNADDSTSETITAKHVYEAARNGDAFALDLIDEVAFYLGIGITGAVHAIDPGLVLLGGAMNFGGKQCTIGQRFLRGVIAEFQKRTFPNVFAGTKIDFATLGGDAGYIGAAAAARQDFHANMTSEPQSE